jgi:hypothetical protein
VCCNVACTGGGFTCQACSAAAKGQGADGVCGAVVTGSDPHMECTAQPATTCGDKGGCDGAGACARWPDGTLCSPVSCKDTSTQNNPKTCVGGKCADPAVQTLGCAPYACVSNMTSGACATSCGMTPYTDTDCSMGSYCDGVGAGACRPKLTTGACTNDDQCASGQCLGGSCCATLCMTGAPCGATACGTTSGACNYPPPLTNCGMGACTSGNTLMGLGVCDGAGSCKGTGTIICPSGHCGTDGCGACAGDGQCTMWGYCSGAIFGQPTGTCKPKKPSGSGCFGSNECLSNNCFLFTCQ